MDLTQSVSIFSIKSWIGSTYWVSPFPSSDHLLWDARRMQSKGPRETVARKRRSDENQATEAT
jgi:hypothetical protein